MRIAQAVQGRVSQLPTGTKDWSIGLEPGVRGAVTLTLRTLEHRARLYRNTVIAISAILLSCPILAIVLTSVYPLVGLLLCVPVTAIFLWRDRRAVLRWRQAVLAHATRHALALSIIGESLGLQKWLPPRTLASMLEELSGATGKGT